MKHDTSTTDKKIGPSTDQFEYVLVHGTLMNEATMNNVAGPPLDRKEVTLDGYYRAGLNILEDSNSSIVCHLLKITREQLDLLDYYEGVSRGFYKRIIVDVDGVRAWAYQLT